MLTEGCQRKLWTEWRLWMCLTKITSRNKKISDIFNTKRAHYKLEQKEEWQSSQPAFWKNFWNLKAESCKSLYLFVAWFVICIRNIFWHTQFCTRTLESLINSGLFFKLVITIFYISLLTWFDYYFTIIIATNSSEKKRNYCDCMERSWESKHTSLLLLQKQKKIGKITSWENVL